MVIELWEPSHKLQMMISPVIRYSKYLIISFQFETRTIQVMFSDSSTPSLPSGKLLQKTMENHHFLWENQLFLWSFSIAMLVITRPGIQWLPGSGSHRSYGSYGETVGATTFAIKR